MNKFAIPAILVAVVMVAGLFAAMPIEQASTVHTTILAGTAEARLATFAGNDCKDDLDDGTLTLTLDAATDAALVIAIHYDSDTTSDGDDIIDLDLNVDGIEIVNSILFDAAPAITDTEILSQFDFGGGALVAGDEILLPMAFTNTFSIDVECSFGANDNDYFIEVLLLVPEADDLSVSAAIT